MTGTWDCRADGDSADLEAFERCLRQSLSCKVDKVFYLHARKRKSRRSDQYVALKGRMVQVCADAGVACEALSSGEVKTFATGNYRAGKDEMTRAAEIYGYEEFEFDDNSAMFVARSGMESFGDA